MEIAIETFRNTINGLYRSLIKTLHNSVPENDGLSITEMQTIGYIYRNEKAFPSELASRAKITMPSMSQILKRMEEKGISQRIPSDEDKRKVYITLTDKGKHLVENARENMDKMLLDRIKTHLNDDEIVILNQAIPILVKLNSIGID